jgi:hypothetical protein
MSRAWQRAVKDDGGVPPVVGDRAAHAYLGHEGVEVVECLCDLGLGLLPLLHHAQMPVRSPTPKASPWPVARGCCGAATYRTSCQNPAANIKLFFKVDRNLLLKTGHHASILALSCIRFCPVWYLRVQLEN